MSAPLPASHRRLLFLLSLAAFASSASFRVGDPMLPVLSDQFAAPMAWVAHIVTGFTIAYGSMQLIYGPLGERLSRYRIVTWATALCALSSLGAAVAQSLDQLVASRVLTGLAAAGIIPMSMAIIADLIPAAQRQAALARFFSGQILGMVFGQLLGGICSDAGSWPAAFAGLTLVYVAIAYALWRYSDLAGLGQASANAATVSVAALYRRAGALLVAPETRTVLACFFIEAALIFGVLAFVPLYLHTHFGLALTQASLPLMLYGAGGLLFSVFASRLGARLNQPRYPVVAATLVALGNLVTVAASHLAWVFAAALIGGFGYYMLHNALLFQITQRVPQARSLGLAVAISLFFIGQSLGVGAAGLLVDRNLLAWVFGLAALCMLPLGLAVSRQVRQLTP